MSVCKDFVVPISIMKNKMTVMPGILGDVVNGILGEFLKRRVHLRKQIWILLLKFLVMWDFLMWHLMLVLPSFGSGD